MSFQSAWGFDPDDLIRAKELAEGQRNVDECDQDSVEHPPPRMPLDIGAQMYELRQMFGLGSATRLDGYSALFQLRFWRCHRLLYVIACRILNDRERANRAIENCWYSASARAPHFEYEGAFRSWLLRVLIDEALLLLGKDQQADETNMSGEADITGSIG